MEVTIVIPFWGDHPAYRRWLEQWYAHYRKSGCAWPVVLASDEVLPGEVVPELERLQCITRQFEAVVNPHYAYDRKGAIVCAVLTEVAGPLLVLDADAWLMHDPAPLLEEFKRELIAMPEDEGAFGRPYPDPHADIVRRCAGVIWFGDHTRETRQALVSTYVSWFRILDAELKAGLLHEERRLLEQHAWTFAAHAVNSPLLPRTLNWPASFPSAGRNPAAAIHHHIGKRKWVGQDAPPRGTLNEQQLRSIGMTR